jgi:hypothetical protein
MTTPSNTPTNSTRPPHWRLRIVLLILGAAVSVISWMAVLLWNGCVR